MRVRFPPLAHKKFACPALIELSPAAPGSISQRVLIYVFASLRIGNYLEYDFGDKNELAV